MSSRGDLGPLREGGRVAVIGGGPGGASAALGLLKGARAAGRRIEVVVFEPKEFGAHYNQCLGVLSPPLLEVLRKELDVEIPAAILQQEIVGYVLYGKGCRIVLADEPGAEPTYAIRRVELDAFLLAEAVRRGAVHVRSRVTNVEFHPEDAIVYHEGGCLSVDVIVGAFGLDSTLRSALRRRTPYDPPPYLETVVCKIHPPEPQYLDLLGDRIHAFLPSIAGIEFAALVPKGDHVSIVVAGRRVGVKLLKRFLAVAEVRALLPFPYEVTAAYKGSFPNAPARGPVGDRLVTVGDSAGLIRPFKGKGIYSAVVTGARAAETILGEGISRKAFGLYLDRCRFLTGDLWYGRLVRHVSILLAHHLTLDPLLRRAETDARLRRALYGAVSGQETYRTIVRTCLDPPVAAGVALTYLRHLSRV